MYGLYFLIPSTDMHVHTHWLDSQNRKWQTCWGKWCDRSKSSMNVITSAVGTDSFFIHLLYIFEKLLVFHIYFVISCINIFMGLRYFNMSNMRRYDIWLKFLMRYQTSFWILERKIKLLNAYTFMNGGKMIYQRYLSRIMVSLFTSQTLRHVSIAIWYYMH